MLPEKKEHDVRLPMPPGRKQDGERNMLIITKEGLLE